MTPRATESPRGTVRWHRGQVFDLPPGTTLAGAAGALRHHPDGAIGVDADGRITWCGPWDRRPAQPDAEVVDHGGAFLLPGFIDTHLHFPQVYCCDAYDGGSLLTWLDRVVFPAESRLADPGHAARAATDLCQRLLAVGTTTALVFGSQFPHAQDALFGTASRTGLRLVSGRTVMTVGPAAASALVTSEADAVALVRDEVDRWHLADVAGEGPGRLRVAVVPRFALSVTPDTLRALGELYAQVRQRGVYVTTHISENAHPHGGEVGAVQAGFAVASYLDVYDGRFLPGSRHGGESLLGNRTVLAHAVHCGEDELDRIAASGTAIAHCPVSQQFLGSGTMPWSRVVRSGVTVGVGTDVAAGDEWFLGRVLNACFKAHANAPSRRRATLQPAQLLHLATIGGAAALDMADEVGSFEPGHAADILVLDADRCPPLDLRLRHRIPEEDPREEATSVLFSLLMAADERAVAQVWIGGRRRWPAD